MRAARRRSSIVCLALLLPGWGGSAAAPDDEALADGPIEALRQLAPAASFDAPEEFESQSGGDTSSQRIKGPKVFSHPSSNLTASQRFDFEVGNAMFRRAWVSAPASTRASDGLGPLFNARACQSCHIKDGRGHVPAANWPDDDAVSMLFKLGVPAAALSRQGGGTVEGAFLPDPVYGAQIQDAAIPALRPEAKVDITYSEVIVMLGDERIRLRKPHYSLRDLAYGKAHPDLVISGRVAPAMIGLGLLAAIDTQALLVRADPDDRDGDGVSGRANWLDSLGDGQGLIGRFGWKAAVARLADQSAIAFVVDMGLSTPLQLQAWGDCTAAQADCREAIHGNAGDPGGPELSQRILDLVEFYSANLAVPVRRKVDDAEVLRGKAAFYGLGCIACHTPKHLTAAQQPPGLAAQSQQLIWPYTDLLLHDMGEGLADGLAEGQASGREWRTTPLWGIGLTKQVSEVATFLHDGRARSLQEAILWHGGEAQRSADGYRDLAPSERQALLAFLESL